MAFVRQAAFHNEASDAAYSVATLLRFGAVSVEDPVSEVGVWVVRREYDQELIEAHARAAVAPGADRVALKDGPLSHQINDHEVVSEAVHLSEAELHRVQPDLRGIIFNALRNRRFIRAHAQTSIRSNYSNGELILRTTSFIIGAAVCVRVRTFRVGHNCECINFELLSN